MLKVVVLLFLGCLCLISGYEIRTEEHFKRQEEFLKIAESLEAEFQQEWTTFMDTGVKSENLNRILTSLKVDRSFAHTEVEDMPPEQAFMSCALCRLTAATYISQIRNGVATDSIANSAIVLCQELTPFGEIVCRGLVELNVVSLPQRESNSR